MKILLGLFWGLVIGVLCVTGIAMCRGIAGPFLYSAF